jgi:hypothetical protein
MLFTANFSTVEKTRLFFLQHELDLIFMPKMQIL